MSHPNPLKDYSDELVGINLKNCPFCDAEDQEGEDLGDHPSYLSFTCENCNREFDSETKSYQRLLQEGRDKSALIERQRKRYEALLVIAKAFSREVHERLSRADDIKVSWEISGIAKSQHDMLEDKKSPLHGILDLKERL